MAVGLEKVKDEVGEKGVCVGREGWSLGCCTGDWRVAVWEER